MTKNIKGYAMKSEINNNIIKKNLYGFEFNLDISDNGATLNKEFFTDKIKNKKAYKEYKKITAVIDFKGHKFQADPVSINFMSATVNLANLKFNQALAKGMKIEDAYKAIYGQTILWKDKSNNWVEIAVGDLGEGIELALEKLKTILEKYS